MPEESIDCDYCDGQVNPTTSVCYVCGYDYSALYESGEYVPGSTEV